MRHFIWPRPTRACPVAVRPRRMAAPATLARPVAPPRRMQRPPTRARCALSAVDVAPIAVAADQHLDPAAWLRAQEQPRLWPVIVLTTPTLVRRPPMPWTRGAAAAMMPLQS